MSNTYNPDSMDAVLARIEQKLDNVSASQTAYQTKDEAWKQTHQASDTSAFGGIHKELSKINASRWTLIGIVLAISTVTPWVISLLK